MRVNGEQKSDIWLLELDKNRRPKTERKLTNFGNVQAISGWHEDLGILFETRTELDGRPNVSQVWAIKASVPGAQSTALPDEFGLVRGNATRRQSVFYIEERETSPLSVIYEVNANGKLQVLMEESCTHRWVTVSADERWLAFESDCPR